LSSCEGCPSKGNCSTEEKGGCSFEQLNQFSSIKNTVAVMSGKGGVGKSSVSVLIARELARRGLKVGILDADITGPSIPRLVGIPSGTRCTQGEMGIVPPKTEDGIPVISLNFFLENEEEPVIWRGPVLSGAVKQFWTDIFWGELDCLVIDMPPGTGDVVLTVMQSLPLSGAVVVSTPHDLASMVVAKSVNMAKKLNIRLIGLVENMAYIKCPDCGKEIRMFDEAPLRDLLGREKLDLLGSLPMLPQIAALSNGEEKTELDADTAKILESIGGKIAEQLK
jgi:ATPases involved in chromosome partitioning